MSKFEDLKKLLPGKKYTLVGLNEFGFPYFVHVTFQTVKFEPYAQYQDAATIVYKKKSGRKLLAKRVYGDKQIIAFRGWIKPDTSLFVGGKTSLPCFDERYLEIARESVVDAPVALVGA